MDKPYSRHSLLEQMAKGMSPRFMFFWGHTPKQEGQVDKSCFSQWFPSSFEVDGVNYVTAEHYMMAGKARLFGDDDMLEKILNCQAPKQAKEFGRSVQNFDADTWQQACFDLVVAGNIAKFAQNDDMRACLLSTGKRILVEAAPRDRIWGIGMGQNHVDAENPTNWRGQNLLGFALMAVRDALAGP